MQMAHLPEQHLRAAQKGYRRLAAGVHGHTPALPGTTPGRWPR